MICFRRFRLVVLLFLFICTAGCDQASKHLARTVLTESQATVLPGGFIELRLAQNPGAFLSLGGALPKQTRAAFIGLIAVGLAGLATWLLMAPTFNCLSFFSLGIVWAGGTSNLIDRFAFQGSVTDFIFVHLGPFHTGIFNVADLAVVAGIALFCFSARPRTGTSEASK
ncbi:MAG TPA: signal peptidase II [Candidatus Dormibacteraeota bacterium]|nr:signal peptidase II [Candidatus Dormibacteraeota bacterium]